MTIGHRWMARMLDETMGCDVVLPWSREARLQTRTRARAAG